MEVDEIPDDWKWPAEPFEPETLREYVLACTKLTQQEQWDRQLELRAGDALQDHTAEKVYANVMLNKEGTGQEQTTFGIDPNAYRAGRWYRWRVVRRVVCCDLMEPIHDLSLKVHFLVCCESFVVHPPWSSSVQEP